MVIRKNTVQEKNLEIESKDIDHLGIVAGIVDDIGLVEEINQLVGTDEQEMISSGLVVKALILNCLGFLTAPLYLFSQFFVGKPCAQLLGKGIKPEHLNDTRLGRVLDKLYDFGLTQVFLAIALKTARKFGLLIRSSHLDSTSMHVHGQYLENGKENSSFEPGNENELKPIHITHGYSKDHRPDLKQFLINIFASGDGDIPLYFQVDDGNASDKEKFPKLIKQFKQEWKLEETHLYVADAALYSKENLETLGNLLWLTRVPLSLKEAKKLVQTTPDSDLKACQVKGYQLAEHESSYGGIKQRWLLLQNDKRRKSDRKQIKKQIKKQENSLEKALKKLSQQSFDCALDAQKAAEQLSKKMKYHQLANIEVIEQAHYNTPGRPSKDAIPSKMSYAVKAQLVEDLTAIELAKQQAGRFVLASNDVKEQDNLPRFTNDELLKEYKDQQSSERGFRFLKDPLFFASSVFVKTARRVATLAMIMALCLLVYTIGQRMLRQNLQQAQESLPNQLGKPTQRPTLRWIFQCFQAVHLIWINGVRVISNLTGARKKILKYFSSACRKYYLMDEFT